VSVLDLAEAISRIETARAVVDPAQALLVGISGIDGSGKGFVAAQLERKLAARGHGVATLNVDGWLNLPHVRFGGPDADRHFYEYALRLDEMFAELVLPLRERRSIELEMDYAEETATKYRRHTYRFAGVDVILLEGIFLFKRAHRRHFDLRLWVECTFDTALRRAIARAQEDLPPAATVRAYETIYFPAQLVHFASDAPRETADIIIGNDLTLRPG
jgi:uridine kinase